MKCACALVSVRAAEEDCRKGWTIWITAADKRTTAWKSRNPIPVRSRKRGRGGFESGQPEPLLQDQLKQMVETGSVTTYNGRHVIHCLTIIGQIEGHYLLPPSNKTTKYEHVIPQLVAVEESPEIQGLLILLNTVGGRY